jgi:hypothetical protein
MGCLLGIVAALLPSLVCGLVALQLSSLLYRWLESWQEFTITILGQEVAHLDLVQFLRLERVLHQLQVLTSASGPLLFLAVLGLALVSGMFLAVVVGLVGVAYNLLASLTGGLVVEMEAAGGQRRDRASDTDTAADT